MHLDKMRAALKAAGKKSEIHAYPDTPHAFYADYRPSYRKQQADDGWKRATAWFKQHGVG
jgi:carboxymethylenebutenolidase